MLKKGRARFLDKFKSKSGASKPLEVHDEENPERTMYPPPLFQLYFHNIAGTTNCNK